MEQRVHLSEKLLARRWELSHRTLERWRHNEHGPSFLKIGRRILYRFSDIEAFETGQFHALAAAQSRAASRRAQ